ncbi:uncharacterized protein LOC142357477, partial [Convolutriloba macropyga]|uniref:uncharacterized protein LOC142357477 n=1 Tax=Convolutriloba macropyga TaxID=536237 RepID=UPI003F51B292
MLVGIWTGSQLRKTLPLTLPSLMQNGSRIRGGGKSGKEKRDHLAKNGGFDGVPQVGNHVHFHLKSAIMATTAQSKRVQFDREYTRSSVSFRTENMYTPGGCVEGGLPKDTRRDEENQEGIQEATQNYIQ